MADTPHGQSQQDQHGSAPPTDVPAASLPPQGAAVEREQDAAESERDTAKALKKLSLLELLGLIFNGLLAGTAIAGLIFLHRQTAANESQTALLTRQYNDAKAGEAKARQDADLAMNTATSQAGYIKTLAEQTTSQAAQTKLLAEQTASLAGAAKDSAIASNRQWHEMEQQVGLMRDQLSDTRKATKDSADAIGRQLTIADTQAGSIKTLADATAMQLERTDRPYITVSVSAVGPATALDRGMEFEIRISVANEGHSVASAVQIFARIRYNGSLNNLKLLGQEIDDYCDTATNLVRDNNVSSRMIRPSEPFVFTLDHTLPINEIRAHIVGVNHRSTGREALFAPALIGCVAYTIPYSTRFHHTPFAFDIIRKLGNPTGIPVFPLGVTVPREEIVLVQNESVLAQRQPD